MKYLAILLLLPAPFIYAQSSSIAIGQQVPDVQLTHLFNYPDSSVNLSRFNRKLLLIDFWGTGCATCIAAFPKMEALQKEFEGDIQVILVNKETRDSTLNFFRKRKKIPFPQLPMVTGDTLLSQMFPHTAVPHHVWIDSAGIVRYITEGYNATSAFIRDFLDGKALPFQPDLDLTDYDGSLPSIAEGNGRWLPRVQYYSYLMQSIPGLHLYKREPDHVVFNNLSIADLFAEAYSEPGKYKFHSREHVIIEAKDTFRFKIPSDNNLVGTWIAEHAYQYELKVPPSRSKDLYTLMQQDLMRYFDVKAQVEMRKIPCLVLQKKGKNRFKSKGGPPATNLYTRSDNPVKYLKNQPIKMLTNFIQFKLATTANPYPFVDATGYKGNIDMNFSIESLDDLTLFNQELEKYGLELAIKKQRTKVLVLYEK